MLNICRQSVRGDSCLRDFQRFKMSRAVRNGRFQELCDESFGLLHFMLEFRLRDAASPHVLPKHALYVPYVLQLAVNTLEFPPKANDFSLSSSLLELAL